MHHFDTHNFSKVVTATSRILREISEGGFKLNVGSVPLDKAREFAESKISDLDKVLPDFNKNYSALQKITKSALNVPRVEMPVIEPEDMKVFADRLKSGRIDIFRPFAKGNAPQFSPDKWHRLDKAEGDEWVELGIHDGKKEDDIVKAVSGKTSGKVLKPTQNQIWLEKLIGNIAKFGVPKTGSPVLSTPIIVSADGFILDGHHRYGQIMLTNPALKLKSLRIPLDIKLLLKVSRTYAGSVGHEPKA